MKYKVYYRVSENAEWSDEFYSEPYIEENSKEDAIDTAKQFAMDCGYDPEYYDWMAVEVNDFD